MSHIAAVQNAAVQLDRTPPPVEAAVVHLVAARTMRVRVAGLPYAISTQQAFDIQDGVASALGARIGGWKCALPSADKIIAAPIFSHDIQSATEPIICFATSLDYEPEIAFTIARDLARHATRDEVIAAIGQTRLAAELVGGRYQAPDTLTHTELLADNLFNQGLVLGDSISLADIAAIDSLTITTAQGKTSHSLRHPAIDPLAPLLWLANAGPHRLKAGMTIITGSFIPAARIHNDCTIEICFGKVGKLALTFCFKEPAA